MYAPLLGFLLSSLGAVLVDPVALLVLDAFTGALPTSVVAARLLSATVNFAVNRRLVFRATRTRSPSRWPGTPRSPC
jgi:putative flippase GtrA